MTQSKLIRGKPFIVYLLRLLLFSKHFLFYARFAIVFFFIKLLGQIGLLFWKRIITFYKWENEIVAWWTLTHGCFLSFCVFHVKRKIWGWPPFHVATKISWCCVAMTTWIRHPLERSGKECLQKSILLREFILSIRLPCDKWTCTTIWLHTKTTCTCPLLSDYFFFPLLLWLKNFF